MFYIKVITSGIHCLIRPLNHVRFARKGVGVGVLLCLHGNRFLLNELLNNTILNELNTSLNTVQPLCKCYVVCAVYTHNDVFRDRYSLCVVGCIYPVGQWRLTPLTNTNTRHSQHCVHICC